MSSSDGKLRGVLYVAAAVCGFGLIGAFGPWSWVQRWIEVQYGLIVEHSPMLEYGVRIACAVYICAAVYFLIIARSPQRHAQFVNLGATGLIFTGVVAFFAGAGLNLRLQGYLTDAGVLALLGLLLFVWSPRWKQKRRRSSRSRRRHVRRSAPTESALGTTDQDRPRH